MVAAMNIFFFVSAVSALAIGRRDASTILSDISAVASNATALTSTVNGYNGGYSVPFQLRTLRVH
jgi:hypothetical protein